MLNVNLGYDTPEEIVESHLVAVTHVDAVAVPPIRPSRSVLTTTMLLIDVVKTLGGRDKPGNIPTPQAENGPTERTCGTSADQPG